MLPTSTNALLPQAGRLTLAALLLLLGLTAAAPAVHAQGYTIKTLASFNGANGSSVYGGLTLGNGILYGTTERGGPNGYGEVFSVPITGGAPTILAAFEQTHGGGPDPTAKLTLSGDTLYGTTSKGGANGLGEVFSVPITGGTPTILTSFDGPNGANPTAGLTLSGGTLYGTTQFGGIRQYGTVFSLPVTGGTPTTLATFDQSATNGPTSDLLLSGGILYGTTHFAGQSNLGSVFSVPVTGGQPTTLTSFDGDNGANPFTTLTLLGGKFYGTTQYGGVANEGTVFSLPVAGGTPTVLSNFGFTNGAQPSGGLTLVGDKFYGTTSNGGLGTGRHYGTFFSVPVTGGTPTTLAGFDYQNGDAPTGGLIYSDGVFYGATVSGGGGTLNGLGSVFAITPNAAPVPEASSLISFGLLLIAGGGGLVLRARRRTAV